MSRNLMRRSSFVLVLFVLVLSRVSGVMACQAPISQAPTGKTALESLNDDSIKAAVQWKLAADNVQDMNVVAFANVVVQAERGAVILSGVVQTSEQKARAEQLAGEVNGVTHVTNNLQVRTGKKR